MRRHIPFTVAVLTGLLASPAALATPPSEPGSVRPFEPQRVQWQRLDYKARKWFMTARSEISIAAVSTDATQAALIGPDGLLPSDGGELRLLSLRSELLGRESVLRLWLHADDAAAVQRIQVETGKRNRYKAYRFFGEGIFSLRRTPGRREAALEHSRWSDVDTGWYSYPLDGPVVTEPSALFYILAAAPIEKAGDSLRIYAYSNNALMDVTIEAVGPRQLTVDYERIDATGSRRVRGETETLRLEVTGRPVEGAGDSEEFEFLGLRGDIEAYLDPRTRVPLQLSGDLPFVGGVDVRLQRLELADKFSPDEIARP